MPISRTAAKRLVKEGAVKVNGKVIKDLKYDLQHGDKMQVGKRTFVTIVKDDKKEN